MANSKYEYVKSFEEEEEVMFPNLIVVRIDGRRFRRFCQIHDFEKPNDKRALNLMNSCAFTVLEEFRDIVFAYGFSDEYSFVFKKTTKFYQRRPFKVLSIVVSFFTSVYVRKWSEFFPERKLQCPPSFHGQVISCATNEVLQAYLLWRQNVCHISNQYDECLWRLVKRGMSESEAEEFLKGAEKRDKNELLYSEFGVNYTKLDCMFRQGSCVLKVEEEAIVKYNENGNPVKRLRRKPALEHSKKLTSRRFWSNQPILLRELGDFVEEIDNVKPEYLRSFECGKKLMPCVWIVARIDGCHFHKFSEVHGFVKPNDEKALDLMNSCAVAVLKEFEDIVFAYGVSDEYSFILRKNSQLYGRRANAIVSAIVSFFTSMYVMKWNDFFPQKELRYPPSFDARSVCYPSENLRDYLSWRQVDCHINNQYNSCFWELVKSGKSKQEAQKSLKGAQLQEKIEELGIAYSALPAMFRLGSSAYRDKEDYAKIQHENRAPSGSHGKNVVVDHCDIIGPAFWLEHSSILSEKQ